MKKNTVKYIEKYINLASLYSEKFYPLFLDRLNIQEVDGIKYLPHGSGISIYDINNKVEIDFDYFQYKGKGIKYFELWKINKFIKSEGKTDVVGEELWNRLEEDGYIKRYFTSSYYSLTGKKKGYKRKED